MDNEGDVVYIELGEVKMQIVWKNSSMSTKFHAVCV